MRTWIDSLAGSVGLSHRFIWVAQRIGGCAGLSQLKKYEYPPYLFSFNRRPQ